jgi:tetratricopeptide (TPR) repeat protein
MTAATQKEMLTPQIQVDTARPQLAWGLGIGLENTSTARYAWHWGDQGDSKALFMVDVKSRNGFVYFTNSANGLSIGPDIMDIVFGKQQHDIAKFIGYGKFEEAAANLMAAIKKEGTVKALQDYEKNRKQVISEGPVNTIGYILLKEKKNTEAIAVFTQNTKDHPASSNAWDSLAEAYMNQGDTIHAIEYYEKSLALDPGNKNAEDQLKKLKK